MYKKDPMLEDIHAVRRKMWEESKQNARMLIENIKKEAKEFVEEHGCRYSTKGRYRKIIRK